MSSEVYTKENETYKLTVFQDETPESPREWSNIGTMVCAHKRYSLGDEKADPDELYTSWEEQLAEEILTPNGGEDAVVYLPLYLYDHSGITMNTTGFSCRWDSGQVGWIYATKQKFRDETGYMEEELFSSDKHRVPKLKEHVKVKGYLLHGTDGWGQVIGIADGKFLVDFDYNKIPSFKKAENVVSASLEEIAEVMSNRAEEMLKGEVETYDDYLTGRVYGYVIEKKETCACCGTVSEEHVDSCWGFYGDSAKEDMIGQAGAEFADLFSDM